MSQEIEIKIPVSHTSELLDLYHNKLNKLEKEIKEVQSIISILQGGLQQTETYIQENKETRSVAAIEKLPNGYIKQWSWQKKIIFVLNKTLEQMTAKAIEQFIISNYEPELKSDEKRVRATISGQLSLMGLKHVISRQQNEIDEYIYSIKAEENENKTDLFDKSTNVE